MRAVFGDVVDADDLDAIASIILEEIEDDARWRAAFAKSQEALVRLADEARAEIAADDVLNRLATACMPSALGRTRHWVER